MIFPRPKPKPKATDWSNVRTPWDTVSWKTAGKSFFRNSCVFNARARAQGKLENGYKPNQVRIGIGLHVPSKGKKDEGHAWCEYLKDGKWILARDSIKGHGGWPIGDYKTSGKRDYEPKKYEYPTLKELKEADK